ncbi:MAG: phosphoglycolate phosphatase [Rhodospirillales bacterium RIFCSPLOWO2_12_FULL_58_28]|nr:MAG: phosphoglycolate phosphatase [Rhodospirillales bacterium RIFCSPLOWO2_02_FULL_58_16]OHC76702.1 MAG: phosphoglycolate phosphatase [Rhodospirillales bacterium RIFCSPLOWO2_12_FULL_58_28]
MKTGINALVLDLDGTLIDSVPQVHMTMNQGLKQIGRRALSLNETKNLIGEGATATIEKALKLTGRAGTSEQVAEFLQKYLSDYATNPASHTVIYPGVIETLETLDACGVLMGLCTNKPQAATLPVLKALDLERFFCAVTCGDSVPYRKPDGRHVTLTLERMGASLRSAAMVGDSETDIAAAHDAEIISIAVSYGYCHAPVAELCADAVIDTFSDLIPTLQRITKKVKTA